MVESIDPAALRVSWQLHSEVNHNEPVTGHVIHYFKDGSQDIKSIDVASDSSFTISGLIACAKYSVRVAAVSDNRTGPFSESVIQVSGEDSELN